ncbi:MAG: sulfatase, partial [Planctomycetota bacterium]|nr:sulfatase [Planctomycetota bacterium]
MPNVILITLDTLRADHLGCYGYDRPTSPRIDAFAETATLYRRGYATSPWTVPTHGSLFTGKFPYEHGAHSFKVDRPVMNVNRLPLEHLTLAEALKSEGYQTGAFIANNGYLTAGSQFNQGFDTYHVERVYADTLNERIFAWLDARRDKRFFIFINHIDTHRPYNTAPRPGITDRPVVRDQGQLLDRLYAAVMPGTGPIPSDLVARVTDQYDTAVANVDAAIGSLLDKLESMGIYDRTLIVLTSDHGEYIGEHHLVEHSKDVYQEVLWVPLIVKGVGQTSGKAIEDIT